MNAKQKDLPIKVKLDSLGKAAEKFLKLRNEKDVLNQSISTAEDDLIMEMEKAQRPTLFLGGATLSLRSIAARKKIDVKQED
jgi:hypothetical protein